MICAIRLDSFGIGNMGQVNKIAGNYVNRKIKGMDEEELISYDPAIAEEMKDHVD